MSEIDSKILTKYNITIPYVVIYLLFVLVGIILRWYHLDLRPLHHDESLNGIYGLYVFNDPQKGYYKYNPLLHGPLLYHLLPYSYYFLGVSKFSVRFIPSLLGTLSIFLPLFFRKFLKKQTILLLTIFIALSPSLVYWSRFLRHDPLVLATMFFALWGFCHAKPRYKAIFILIGFALHLCTKENAYITIAILSGYLLFEHWLDLLYIKRRSTLLRDTIKNIQNYLHFFILGLLTAALIYIYYYTAGFQYWPGLLDGLYRKSLIYWFNQHNVERISGPFIYHFFVLSWYDLTFIVALISHLIIFYKKVSWSFKAPFLITFFICVAFHASISLGVLPPIRETFLFHLFKLKITIDCYPFFLLIVHAVTVTIYHLVRQEKDLSFWGYTFFATLFTYSFIGEKVPWLSIYPLVTGAIYLALYFQKIKILTPLSKRTKSVLKVTSTASLIIFTLFITIKTNFTQAGKAQEFISQVHTDQNYEHLAYKIRDKIKNINPKELAPTILTLKDNTWPLSWYMYGLPQYVYYETTKNIKSFDFVFTQTSDKRTFDSLASTHRKFIIPLRVWWLPHYNKLSWYNYFRYTFTHIPWNSTGKMNIAIYINKRLDSKEFITSP